MIMANYIQRLCVSLMFSIAMGIGAAQASPLLQVDVAGILNNDERGAASNIILDFHVGAGSWITSLDWNVNVTSFPGSYLSEMQFTFSDSLGNGVTFTPGDGDDFDGTVDYAGSQDLGALGLMFQVGADGILRLEFHDGYKDLAFDEPEGVWNSGMLTFAVAEVPEPPAIALMLAGFLLLANTARRRRKNVELRF